MTKDSSFTKAADAGVSIAVPLAVVALMSSAAGRQVGDGGTIAAAAVAAMLVMALVTLSRLTLQTRDKAYLPGVRFYAVCGAGAAFLSAAAARMFL